MESSITGAPTPERAGVGAVRRVAFPSIARVGSAAKDNASSQKHPYRPLPDAPALAAQRAIGRRSTNDLSANLITFPTSGFAAPMQAHGCSLAAISWERSGGPARC